MTARPRRESAEGTRVKRCAKCGLKKPIAEFNRHRASADGRQSYCRSCAREYRVLHSRGSCVNASREPEREFLCSTCGYKQDLADFGSDADVACSDMPAFCPACGDVVYRRQEEMI